MSCCKSTVAFLINFALFAGGIAAFAFHRLLLVDKAQQAEIALVHGVRAFGVALLATALLNLTKKHYLSMIFFSVTGFMLETENFGSPTPTNYALSAIFVSSALLDIFKGEEDSASKTFRRVLNLLLAASSIVCLFKPTLLLDAVPGNASKNPSTTLLCVARETATGTLLFAMTALQTNGGACGTLSTENGEKNAGFAVAVHGALLLVSKYISGALQKPDFCVAAPAAVFCLLGLTLLFQENGSKMVACGGDGEKCCPFSACCFGGAGENKSRSQSSSQPAPVKSKKGKSKSKK